MQENKLLNLTPWENPSKDVSYPKFFGPPGNIKELSPKEKKEQKIKEIETSKETPLSNTGAPSQLEILKYLKDTEVKSPAPDLSALEGIAQAEGKIRELDSKALAAYHKGMEEQVYNVNANLLTKQLDRSNEAYNKYLTDSEDVQGRLNRLNEKYPSLSRGDLINNMSAGQKITTAALLFLGGLKDANNNPALKVFNETLDSEIQASQQGFQNAYNSLMAEKGFNKDKFDVLSSNLKEQSDLQIKALENTANLMKSRLETPSDEKQKAMVLLAVNKIRAQINQINNDYQVKSAELKLNQQKIRQETITSPNVVYFENKPFTLSNTDARAAVVKMQQETGEAEGLLDRIQKSLTVGDKSQASSLIKIYNEKYKDQGEINYGAFTSDAEVISVVDSLKRAKKSALGRLINDNSVTNGDVIYGR